jgi:20S proteasome alpha/beta subunit
MTVCVGALCEKGQTVVVAADRMLTFGAPMNLQAEPPFIRKIFTAGSSCVLLFSGSVPDGEELMTNVQNKTKGAQKPSIAQIGEIAKECYAELKKKRAEENILRPILGANFATLQTLIVQASSSQILQQVIGLLMQHNLQLDILIAGTDADGGHLFVASHPGQLVSTNMVGFAAIGSGGLHAAIRLSLSQHSPESTLEEAVFNVYEAKSSAEVAPGVGKFTDVAFVRNGNILFLQPEFVSILEKYHKEKPDLTKEEWEVLRKELHELTNGDPTKPNHPDPALH